MNEKIKILILDVDGTLTDGKIYMGNNGEQFKVFNIKDGYAINNMLPSMGILPVIITGRTSEIVNKRAHELNINYLYQGVQDKASILNNILLQLSKDSDSYTLKNVAYCGDDCNDLACMEEIKKFGGIVACPKDAANEVLLIADYISEKNGGDGAVRDFVEWLKRI